MARRILTSLSAIVESRDEVVRRWATVDGHYEAALEREADRGLARAERERKERSWGARERYRMLRKGAAR